MAAILDNLAKGESAKQTPAGKPDFGLKRVVHPYVASCCKSLVLAESAMRN